MKTFKELLVGLAEADKDKEILESVVLIISVKSITAKPFKTKLNRILTGI